jgi:hypothetical protein
MDSMKTNFQPKLNGFQFINSFDFPDFFQLKLPFLSLSAASLSDLIYGLCGGMCFAALDYYHAQISPPPYGTTDLIPWPYFLYLWQRQLDSLGKLVVPKIFEWMLSDDVTLARKINRWEVPKIMKQLKEGQPVVLAIIRVKGITDPTKNHQVVAIGYEYETTNKDLKFFLYDPNHPGEQPELTMNLNNPNLGIGLDYSTGEPLRGFFALDYQKQTPPVI